MTYEVTIARNVFGSPNTGATTVFPDWAGGKVYAWNDIHGFSATPTLYENSLTDGSVLNSATWNNIFVVSGNKYPLDATGVVLNGFMYVLSSNNTSFGNLRLSRIDLSTLVETAAYNPAILSAAAMASYADRSKWAGFSIAGTDYLIGVVDNSSANPNIQVINAATGASVVADQYPHGGSFEIMTPGGVSGTVATFWIFTAATLFGSHYLVRAQFDSSGNVLTFSTIGAAKNPTDLNASGTLMDPSFMVYDQTDGHVIIDIGISVPGNASGAGYLTKYNTTTGALVWSDYLNGNGADLSANGIAQSVVVGGVFPFTQAVSCYREYDTSDGSLLSSYSNTLFNVDIFTTYTGNYQFVWNGTDRVLLLFSKDQRYRSEGWRIIRPDDSPPMESFRSIDGAGRVEGFYQDSDPTTPIYDFRYLPDSAAGQTSVQVVSRDPNGGALITAGPVWNFASAIDSVVSTMPTATSAQHVNQTFTSADGLSKMYFRVVSNALAFNSNASAVVEIDRTTFAVTNSKLSQANGRNYDPGDSGTPIRGSDQVLVSPDGTFVVSGIDNDTYQSLGLDYFRWRGLEIWCPATGQYAYLHLESTIGIATTDRVTDPNGFTSQINTCMCFDSAGFLYFITQPIAAGTFSPITGTSTLWKVQINGAGLVPPTLTLVNSYSVPDGFFSGSSFFDLTFTYFGITHNPSRNKLYLSSGYFSSFSNPVPNSIWCMEFDIAGETFSAPIDQGSAGYIGSSGRWNSTDLNYLWWDFFGSHGLIVTDTSAMTADNLGGQCAFYEEMIGNSSIFYLGSLTYYVNGANGLGPGPLGLLEDTLLFYTPSPVVYDESVDEAETAADMVTGGLVYADTVSELTPAADVVSAPGTLGPLWMSITGGAGRESIYPI